MKEPLRLRDDPSASGELRSILAAGSPSKPMTAAQRARTSRRIATLAAVPVATASFFTLKGVALAAVALGGSAVAAVTLASPWGESAPVDNQPARASVNILCSVSPSPNRIRARPA